MRDTIHRRMAELGIDNIRELERAAGVKKDVIGNMLRGRSRSVRSESIPGIAEALDISIPELLTGAPDTGCAPAWETLDVRSTTDDLNTPDSTEQIGFALRARHPAPAGETDFALRIEDDTMAPTISRGDLVFIRRVERPCSAYDTDRANICLIKTEHSDLRVRRLSTRMADGKIDVQTDNRDYADEIGIDAASITIYGTVEYVLKRL